MHVLTEGIRNVFAVCNALRTERGRHVSIKYERCIALAIESLVLTILLFGSVPLINTRLIQML